MGSWFQDIFAYSVSKVLKFLGIISRLSIFGVSVVADVSTTCAVVIFRIKVSCITPGGVLDISLGEEVQRGPSYPDPV